MKRLANYIPELMLAAGLLTAIGIYCSCTVPLGHACAEDAIAKNGRYCTRDACVVNTVAWIDNRKRPDAELYGKWMQVGPATATVATVGSNLTSVHCYALSNGSTLYMRAEVPIAMVNGPDSRCVRDYK